MSLLTRAVCACSSFAGAEVSSALADAFGNDPDLRCLQVLGGGLLMPIKG
jgi:hypothetical protein